MTNTATGGPPVLRVQKGYYLDVDLVRDVDHLAIDLGVRANRFVEETLRRAVDEIKAGVRPTR